MGGNTGFWYFFGGIWLVVGLLFLAASLGVNLFADPAMGAEDAPPWLFALAGIVMSAAGAAIIHFARTAAARDRRLMESGILINATVTDVQRSRIDINRQTRWHVAYRYEYTRGRTFEGRSRALPASEVQGYRPGDEVKIKVDPQNPAESLFLGPAEPSRV